MELVTQRKDKERQEEEEVTEELERATMPEMAKELSLFEYSRRLSIPRD